MKAIALLVSILFCITTQAAENKLVDVDKNSKLSEYFKKINGKVSDNSEEKSLVKIKKLETADASSLKEDEILLKEATSNAKKTSSLSPVNKMMMAIMGLLFVSAICFAGVQKMGKKQGHTQIAKNIKVLTQKSIGPKKNLMLIRVAGETILLGVTDHNINHLKTLSLMEDELPGFTEPKFSSSLKDKIEKTKEEPALLSQEHEEVDGFAISSLDDVKDAVGRYSI